MATEFESSFVVVDTSDTVIFALELGGGDVVCSIDVVSGTSEVGTLDDFVVQLRNHEDGDWYDYLDQQDYDNVNQPNMPFASQEGPHEVQSGNTAHLTFKANGVGSVRFQAKSVSTSVILIRGLLTGDNF